MKTENVKLIVQELFKAHFNRYPENYPLNNDGTATIVATETVADIATGYFDNRTEEEIDRDNQLSITKIDYIEWCMEEFSDLILNN